MAILVNGRLGGGTAEAITGYDDPGLHPDLHVNVRGSSKLLSQLVSGRSKLATKCRSNIGNSLLRKLVAAVSARVSTNTRRAFEFSRRKWEEQR